MTVKTLTGCSPEQPAGTGWAVRRRLEVVPWVCSVFLVSWRRQLREDNDREMITSQIFPYFCTLNLTNREVLLALHINPTYSTQENTCSAAGRQAQPQTLYFLLPCPSQCLILALFRFLSVLSLLLILVHAYKPLIFIWHYLC